MFEPAGIQRLRELHKKGQRATRTSTAIPHSWNTSLAATSPLFPPRLATASLSRAIRRPQADFVRVGGRDGCGDEETQQRPAAVASAQLVGFEAREDGYPLAGAASDVPRRPGPASRHTSAPQRREQWSRSGAETAGEVRRNGDGRSARSTRSDDQATRAPTSGVQDSSPLPPPVQPPSPGQEAE
jgi:hypothetical protein